MVVRILRKHGVNSGYQKAVISEIMAASQQILLLCEVECLWLMYTTLESVKEHMRCWLGKMEHICICHVCICCFSRSPFLSYSSCSEIISCLSFRGNVVLTVRSSKTEAINNFNWSSVWMSFFFFSFLCLIHRRVLVASEVDGWTVINSWYKPEVMASGQGDVESHRAGDTAQPNDARSSCCMCSTCPGPSYIFFPPPANTPTHRLSTCGEKQHFYFALDFTFTQRTHANALCNWCLNSPYLSRRRKWRWSPGWPPPSRCNDPYERDKPWLCTELTSRLPFSPPALWDAPLAATAWLSRPGTAAR